MRLLFLLLITLVFSASKPVKSTICLSSEEQKLYEMLMAYRQSKRLPTIPLSEKLTRVAQLHAKDLSEHHDPFNGTCNLHSWSNKGNWSSCCYTNDHALAECMWNKPREISGYTGNGYEISYYSGAGANAEEGVAGWKKSTGHNQVIVNEGIWKKIMWNAIGIGIYKEYAVVWFGEIEDEPVLNCQ